MKILNLYAGIGGNRKLWGDEHDVTAVELEEDIGVNAFRRSLNMMSVDFSVVIKSVTRYCRRY